MLNESAKISIFLCLENFLQDESSILLEFPSHLGKNDRAFVKSLCPKLNLFAQSFGSKFKRFIKVAKSNYAFENSKPFCINIPNEISHILTQFFKLYSLSFREKCEISTSNERINNLYNCFDSDFDNTIGKIMIGSKFLVDQSILFKKPLLSTHLPIHDHKTNIIDLINSNNFTFIYGESFIGKSTQIPLYILQNAITQKTPVRIICVKPSQLSCQFSAYYLAKCTDTKIGQFIGFQSSLESKISPRNLITFCCANALIQNFVKLDSQLGSLTHILIDEIYPFSCVLSVLMICLKALVNKSKKVKIVIISSNDSSRIVDSLCKFLPHLAKYHINFSSIIDAKVFYLEDTYAFYFENSCDIDDLFSGPLIASNKAKSLALEDFIKKKGSLFKKISNYNILNFTNLLIEADLKIDSLIEYLWSSCDEDMFTRIINHAVNEKPIYFDKRHSVYNLTLLMVACGLGLREVAYSLICCGASLQAMDVNGSTPYDWAIKFKNSDVQNLLCTFTHLLYFPFKFPKKMDVIEKTQFEHSNYQYSLFFLNRIAYIVNLIWLVHTREKEGVVLAYLPRLDDALAIKDMLILKFEESVESAYEHLTVFILSDLTQLEEVYNINGLATKLSNRVVILSTSIGETIFISDKIKYIIDCGIDFLYTLDEKNCDLNIGKYVLISSERLDQRTRILMPSSPSSNQAKVFRLFPKSLIFSSSSFQEIFFKSFEVQSMLIQSRFLSTPNISMLDFVSKLLLHLPVNYARHHISNLKLIDIFDATSNMCTEFGKISLTLPLPPNFIKAIILSLVLKCLHPIITTACFLSNPSVFITSKCQNENMALDFQMSFKRRCAENSFSDHFVLLKIFQSWIKSKSDGWEQQFCQHNSLNQAVLYSVLSLRSNVLGLLRANGFIKHKGALDIREVNANANNWSLVKAVLITAFYNNIGQITKYSDPFTFAKLPNIPCTQISPFTSFVGVLGYNNQFYSKKSCQEVSLSKNTSPHSPYFLYDECVSNNDVSIVSGLTMVSPIALVLFAGPLKLSKEHWKQQNLEDLDSSTQENFFSSSGSEESNCKNENVTNFVFDLDDFLKFYSVPDSLIKHLLHLRYKLSHLTLKLLRSSFNCSLSSSDNDVISTIAQVLTQSDDSYNFKQPSNILIKPKFLFKSKSIFDCYKHSKQNTEHSEQVNNITNNESNLDLMNSIEKISHNLYSTSGSSSFFFYIYRVTSKKFDSFLQGLIPFTYSQQLKISFDIREFTLTLQSSDDADKVLLCIFFYDCDDGCILGICEMHSSCFTQNSSFESENISVQSADRDLLCKASSFFSLGIRLKAIDFKSYSILNELCTNSSAYDVGLFKINNNISLNLFNIIKKMQKL